MISVCMATYNGEKYIEEQLQSILKQIGQSDEVIISDDGSTDNTINIVKSMNDSRIKICVNKGKHGFTRNFENALKNATGDMILLSDQDDIWMDNKVSIIKQELEKFDFVTHDCITVDKAFNIISESRFKEFNIKAGFINHLIRSRYLGCCMAFNKNVLNTCIPFPARDDLIEHDIWIAAVAFAFYKCKMIDKPLIYYRRHGENASNGGFTKGYSAMNKIWRRMYRVMALFKVRKRAKNDIYL